MNCYTPLLRRLTVLLTGIGLLLGLSVSSWAKTTAPEPIQRALFVGNSFSYYNNGLQNHVGNLVRSAQQWQSGTTRYRMATVSGGNLSEHVAGVPNLLKDQAFQALVIQGLSNGPIKSNQSNRRFQDNAAKLIAIGREQGAEPILFMTWPYADSPEMTELLLQAYAQVATEHQVMLVPVGLAFAAINEQFPEINLYVPDILAFNDDETSNNDQLTIKYKKAIKHPSIAGTYLAACMFYAAFYQQSPVGLAYTAGLTPEQATILQQVAWTTLVEYSRNNKSAKHKKAQS